MLNDHSPARTSPLDVSAIRRDFPILGRTINGLPMIYLDSAATSLKPQPVIDAIVEYYTSYTSNVKRGVHPLGDEASERFEEARSTIAGFIHADPHQLVFVRNTTEAINVVARSLTTNAPVLYCVGDHHSNQLPWRQSGMGVAVGIRPDGSIDLEQLFAKLKSDRPKLLAVSHISNAFGAVNPIEQIIQVAHQHDCQVLVDASQSVPHRPIDVEAMGCDYLCFSGHKMCGPSGIGVLYGTRQSLENLQPWSFGGSMVSEVHADRYELEQVPWRFEAGTPCIEGVIGLAAACDYLETTGVESIHRHEQLLINHALERFASIPSVKLYGPLDPAARSSVVTFSVPGLEAHAVAKLLSNRDGILVRSGYHCAQPAHEAVDAPPTVRASVYLYNDMAEIDTLADAVINICRFLV